MAIDYNRYIITADSIQPLVSNVVGKQMGTSASSGEAQYMQQQSQVFVFSTQLANTGADAVLRGEYHSLVAYHCAQPATKKYLEVYYMCDIEFISIILFVNSHSQIVYMSNILQKLHFLL